MEQEQIVLPDSWALSDKQEFVIGTLLDYKGDYVSTETFTKGLYGVSIKPSPAKFRVTMQRCRDIVFERTDGIVEIKTKRGQGWKLTVRNALILKKYIDLAP